MSLPTVVNRDEWLAARKELLDEEKALWRRRDELNTKRREMPMVEIDKPYRFTHRDGEQRTLLDLFDGQRQLIVGHFMFDPEWEDGCASCSAGAEELAQGLLDHLRVRDTAFTYVSLAPIEKIEAYRNKRGWDVPWVSSHGSDFNVDFHVTVDPSKAAPAYNFRSGEEYAARGADLLEGEYPGQSYFLRDGDRVFHTNSVYARGVEMLGGSYAWLDQTALGRQEEWEKPEGRSDDARAGQPDFAR